MSLALAQAGAALVHDFGPDVDVSLHADGPPVVVRATSPTLRSDPVAAADWFVARRRAIDAVLPDWGAIMFQRFALPTTTDFENAVRDYASPPHGYSGGATPRSNIQVRRLHLCPPRAKMRRCPHLLSAAPMRVCPLTDSL